MTSQYNYGIFQRKYFSISRVFLEKEIFVKRIETTEKKYILLAILNNA